jgi:hypothetical protein
MAGFGFLSDMNKTLKLNRDNLKRSLPKPFDKDRLSEMWTTENVRLKDAPPMSAAERDRFLQRLTDERRKQFLVRVLVLSTLGAAALMLLFFMIDP